MTTFTTPPDDPAVASAPLLERVEAYEDWRQAQGVPLVTGFYIEDMNEVEVAPWARKGVNGAIVNLEGTGDSGGSGGGSGGSILLEAATVTTGAATITASGGGGGPGESCGTGGAGSTNAGSPGTAGCGNNKNAAGGGGGYGRVVERTLGGGSG